MNRWDILHILNTLPFDRGDYWLVSGGAMVLYGLREETSDIDLGCSKRLADALEQQGCRVIRLEDGTRQICYQPGIELFENWFPNQSELVGRVPVLSLEGLLAMKKSLGREKDKADIRRIGDLLRTSRQAQD